MVRKLFETIKHQPFQLYARAIDRITFAHDMEMDEVCMSWHQFAVENQVAIQERNYLMFMHTRILYKNKAKIYLDLVYVFEHVDDSIRDELWSLLESMIKYADQPLDDEELDRPVTVDNPPQANPLQGNLLQSMLSSLSNPSNQDLSAMMGSVKQMMKMLPRDELKSDPLMSSMLNVVDQAFDVLDTLPPEEKSTLP